MQRVPGCKVLTGFLLFLASSGLTADQKFSDTTQVTVVEVPVQVVRDGEPVRGLKAADFAILEGHKERPITGFDVVDLAAPESQLLSADIPAAGKRHFLLLFDLAHSNPKTIARARVAVMGSLLKTLTPSDLAAVAVYSPSSGLKLVLGFTSDLRQIARAVDDLGLGIVDRHPAMDTLTLASSQVASSLQGIQGEMNHFQAVTTPNPGESAGHFQRRQTASDLARELLPAMQLMMVQAAGEILHAQEDEMAQAKSNVSPMTGAFADLARMMDAVSGRKLVVLFSEGFDSTVLTGDEDFAHERMRAEAIIKGGSIAVDTEERYGSTRQTDQMEKMLEQFRRSDCVIESVDISGLRGMDLDANAKTSGEGSLMLMARDTGGEVFRNFNDLGEAMDRIARRTSVTYVLSFQPEGLSADGSYHPIKVQLKSPARGTHLTYRTGYYSPRPYNQRRPLEKMLAAADQLMGANQSGSITTAVLATPFRTGAAKAYVPVFVEVDGPTLLAGFDGPTPGAPAASAGPSNPSKKPLPIEIYAYAVDAGGSIQDYLNQTLQLDMAKAAPILRQGGLKYYGHLELAPGEYAVRVLLRNAATGAYGKRSVLVRVPEFGSQEPILLPPLFPEAAGRWAVVRESPRGEQKDAAYPFVLGQQAFMPASCPALRPGEEVALALLGYNLGADFKTEAKLESADGRDLGAGTIRFGAVLPGVERRPDVFKAFFRPPQALAPGNYRLVVTGFGPGGSPQRVTSAFSIASPAPGGMR